MGFGQVAWEGWLCSLAACEQPHANCCHPFQGPHLVMPHGCRSISPTFIPSLSSSESPFATNSLCSASCPQSPFTPAILPLPGPTVLWPMTACCLSPACSPLVTCFCFLVLCILNTLLCPHRRFHAPSHNRNIEKKPSVQARSVFQWVLLPLGLPTLCGRCSHAKCS